MDMFNKKSMNERIGNIEKSSSLNHLKEVEKYFLSSVKKYKIEAAYDVIANELPYFKTFNYTEWAHSFIMHPLQQELRVRQMVDAYNDDATQKVDYISYFKDRIMNGQSNKYTHIIKDEKNKPREHLVVLVGSNKLKERICLNKLRWIRDQYEDDVWFKPHPLTTHALVGELKDLLGENRILHRDADMYEFMLESKIVHNSHLSESLVYAIALDKEVDPIDVYQKAEQGSFYHINKFLFTEQNPKEWVNRTLNSPKCGIINPEVDTEWKKKIDDYLEYINTVRNSYKNRYV
jgi:hypothetical protein